ncbi:hypothetical protein A8O28_14570 [Enterobacteriaceae bacterium CCUG 67584]|nr:hypothetical protein [Enterobacteriaceae bacterium CCUG 67584]
MQFILRATPDAAQVYRRDAVEILCCRIRDLCQQILDPGVVEGDNEAAKGESETLLILASLALDIQPERAEVELYLLRYMAEQRRDLHTQKTAALVWLNLSMRQPLTSAKRRMTSSAKRHAPPVKASSIL